MDIQATKLRLMQLLLNTNEVKVLQQLKEVFDKESIDIWDELSADDKLAISEGIDQLDKGQCVSHKGVKDEIKREFKF